MGKAEVEIRHNIIIFSYYPEIKINMIYTGKNVPYIT